MSLSSLPRRFSTPIAIAISGSLALGLGLGAQPSEAAAASIRPDKITNVWVTKDAVGTFTVRWSSGGANTTKYAIETGLTSFSKTDKTKPAHGRHYTNFYAPKSARAFTFNATALARAGAPVGSGNHVYFRVSAIRETSSGRELRYYPFLEAAMPKAPMPQGTTMRVASFNVRTAHANDKRNWLQRVNDVTATIEKYRPAVVAMQELNVGRADGKTGVVKGYPRQTESLLNTLRNRRASQYKLVRTTPYVMPGTPQSTQGERILFDSSRLTLNSYCPNYTGARPYSGSCSIALPLAKGDSKSRTRRAGFAQFTDKVSNRSFIFVSVHLDERHTGSASTQRIHDQLRAAQIATVHNTIAKFNKSNLPVIIAGDYNTWQNFTAGNSAHDWLIQRGYVDSASAPVQVNFQYSTLNQFATTVPRTTGPGYASRLDQILVKGMHGSKRFENVMKVTDTSRASDHNMVYGDLVF